MRFQDEPAVEQDQGPCVGVLLVNLGTPQAPATAAVRHYLAEFLSDPRVVEWPRLLWLLILHGVILRTRPARSAAKYAKVWTADGSPLAVWSARQAVLLRGYLGELGAKVHVRAAMRYGQPSIASGLDELKARGCQHILILPLYPQYAASTTASAVDAVSAWAARQRRLPELRLVNQFHDDAGYIAALAARIRGYWQEHGRPDHLVMSFHGLPERAARLGDPYPEQCRQTARLLAARLELEESRWQLAFQSRMGRARWLEPATQPTLERLARQGASRVDVACPGFVSDCLETLEEIGLQARAAFQAAGGRELHAVPCLNDSPAWIAALTQIAQRHLQGWPVEG
ncbi:MAG: ferrochelatase [Burkholderiaceae bacterium]|jgi:ferrochelatase|nr:ferrochelatase [Burkholderiaceae bacterium]